MIRFTELMLWLSLLVLVIWGVYAVAEPIYLHACSKKTCQMGAGLTGSDLIAYDLKLVSDSKECPDRCSIVDYGTGRAHVMGHWLDIGCRAWGGAPCMWDRKAYGREMMKGITEDRYRE